MNPLVDPSIWTQPGANRQASVRAGVEFLASVIALVSIGWALPAPSAVINALTGRTAPSSAGAADAIAVTGAAVLLVAAVVVWLLLLWALVVVVVAGCSRLPGGVGECAETILRRLAPAAVRRVVLSVVGASMVSGLAACGTVASPAASVPSQGQHLVDNSATVPQSRNPLGTRGVEAGQDRSWIAVEGSAIHLGPVSSALRDAVRRSFDPQGDPGGAFHLPVTVAAIGVDWPVADHLAIPAGTPPSGPVSIDWPTEKSSAARSNAAKPVVVLRGDTLWAIAARSLGSDATPSEIDRSWHEWYAANTAIIGADPNLILPGQILLPPEPGTGGLS